MDAATVKRSIGAEQSGVQVILTNPDQLSAFIRENPDTPMLIRGAIERLPTYFPGDRVEVGVELDPDEGLHPEVVVMVRTRLPAAAAMDALDRFDHDWYLPSIRKRMPARLPVLVSVRQA